jgi:hypothetical protein
MKEFLSLPWYIYAVPCGAVVGAISVSRILKISRFASLVGAMAPLALPYADLPESSKLAALKPHYQVLGAWGVLLLLALGLVMARALYCAVRKRLGLVRSLYSALLLCALAVIALLFAKPEVLQEVAPDWRDSVGGVLLGATLIGVGLASANVIKSAASLVVWSLASVVLASQVFFLKMPYDLDRADLERIQGVFPKGLPRGFMLSGVERLINATSSSPRGLRSTSSDEVES